MQKIDKQKAMEADKQARDEINAKINKEYYTSKKFVFNSARTSVNEGYKMGMQQALGIVIVEFFTAVLEEVEDIFKKGFYTCENFFESLKIRLKKIADKVKQALIGKYKEIVKSFGDGFMSGILSNLTTTIINIFATTSARLVRIIREGIFSFFKAIKLVLFPPENLTQEQVWYEAKKLIVSAVIVGLGVVQDRIHIPGVQKVMQTIADLGDKDDRKAQVLIGSEISETQSSTQNVGDSYTETLDLIPIESIRAGDVKKVEDSNSDAEKGQKDVATKESEADAKAVKSEYYVVKAGDTLTSICNKVYGSTEKLKELKDCNQLEDADDIHVDQKLLLP